MCVCADLRVPANLCRLADHKMCTTPDTSGLCRATTMLGKQSPKACAGKPSAHRSYKKQVARAGKVHKWTLSAFACSIRAAGKPLLAEIRPILASFAVLGVHKISKMMGCAHQIQTKMRRNHPKNGIWRHCGPVEGHFYPFWTNF